MRFLAIALLFISISGQATETPIAVLPEAKNRNVTLYLARKHCPDRHRYVERTIGRTATDFGCWRYVRASDLVIIDWGNGPVSFRSESFTPITVK
jgi:hypothetical protein